MELEGEDDRQSRASRRASGASSTPALDAGTLAQALKMAIREEGLAKSSQLELLDKKWDRFKQFEKAQAEQEGKLQTLFETMAKMQN